MHRATAPGPSAATEGGPHFTRFATEPTIQAHAVRACGRPLMQVVLRNKRESNECKK